MRNFLTIILLLSALVSCGQPAFDKTRISKPTGDIVSRIEKINELMGSAVYEGGIRPPQYDNFTELQKKASKQELVELTNHPNGVVRCYSFWALSYDSTSDLLPIIIRHISDTALVKTQFGCIGSREPVGDFFITVVTPEHVDLNSKKLSPAQFHYLDSVLIYTANSLYATTGAISRAPLSEKLYARLREMVVKEKDQPALVKLARFKREQDIPLILDNKMADDPHNPLFYTYKAMAAFPHKAMLPFLRKNLYESLDDDLWSGEWAHLYRAIAAFKTDSALMLLKVPFTKVKHQDIRKYHINFVFQAIKEFYSPMYDDLLWSMWEKENKISSTVFKMLYLQNPGKALKLTKRTVQNADDFELETDEYETEDYSDYLLDVMVDTVFARDKDFAVDLINKIIRQGDGYLFTTFADKALKVKDASFVASLLARLEHEWNPHVYLKASQVLIAYNDNSIKAKLVEISKRNSNMSKGWGGEEFAKLLQENNIK